MRFLIVGVLGLLLVGVTAMAQEPVGDEFQINSYTTANQVAPSVAADAQGNFVVVWLSDGSDGTDIDGASVQGQRYDVDGTSVGDQFQVNSYTTEDQYSAAVASDAQGNFLVVWESYGSFGTDSDGKSIQGQSYDSNGAAVGSQFQVNSYTTGRQYEAAVAVGAQGNFLVVWESYGSLGTDTDGYSVQAQLYDTNGIPLGGQFQVNSYTTGRQYEAAVAADSRGNFVVAWHSHDFFSTRTIQAQRLDAIGAPVGGQFQVNSYSAQFLLSPAVAADAQGNFVVVWESYGSLGTDTDWDSIQSQFYDADGKPVGGQFQVNSYTTSYQRGSAVAADPHGNFLIAWHSDGSFGTDSDSWSIQGQRYDASGAPIGSEFQVNSYTTSRQAGPAVAADNQGNFIVAWHSNGSYGTDDSRQSIQGQRYSTGGILVDGFESGDTSAWSASVP